MGVSLRAEDDWKTFGEKDPYFGVLSDAKFKTAALDTSALDAFFASGVTDIDKVMTVARSMFGTVPTARALDFGCGVGRVTNALAAHFDQVVGLDISPGMLARARIDSNKRGVTNVTYASSLDTGVLQPGTYDFVHSYIVLQHIPTKIGEVIVRDMLNATKPGGMGAIHFTYGHAANPMFSRLKNLIKTVPVLRDLANVALGRKRGTPAMQMNCYALPRMIDIFAECGIDRFNIVRVDDWGNLGAFVFFEKRTGAPTWSNPKPRR